MKHTDDTSRYGKVRKARLGEIGTHLASESIKKGDALVIRSSKCEEQEWEYIDYLIIQALREGSCLGYQTYNEWRGLPLEPWMIHQKRVRDERKRQDRAFYIKMGFLALCLVIGIIGAAVASAEAKGADQTVTPLTATVTAYTSSEDETDSDPTVNASGGTPQAGSIACPPYLPFGTQVRIEGQIYTCDDRMHSRFAERFDIWVETKEVAFEWGNRTVAVEIL